MNLSSEEDRKVEREGRRDEPLLIAIPCTIPFAAQFCKYFRYLRSIVRYPRQLGSDEGQRQREKERARGRFAKDNRVTVHFAAIT